MKGYINPNSSNNAPCALVTDIRSATRNNCDYRDVLWTGENLQCALMSIPPCGEIGLEVHPDTDQCLCVECGRGMCVTGESEHSLDCRCPVNEGSCVFVPAGTWHNITNTGSCPLRLFSLYAPPHHAPDTVQRCKSDADREEK